MKHGTDISDIHFTYPLDGNLHYTYKFSDGSEVRGYWDEVEHRPPGHPQGTPSLSLGSREAAIAQDSSLLLRCPMLNMLPNYKPASLQQYAEESEFFQFPMIMTSLASDIPFFTREFSSRSRPRKGKGDVEVEGDSLDSIEILTFLVGRGHAFSYAPPQRSGQTVHRHVIDDRQWPHIHTLVLTRLGSTRLLP
jgi:hypothetical protein